jgi:hypothetical protein
VSSDDNVDEIGIHEARKILGPLANRAHLAGRITYLTRNGTRIAAIVPLDKVCADPPDGSR